MASGGVLSHVSRTTRGGSTPRISKQAATYEGKNVVKEELLPDGRRKLILSNPTDGAITDVIVSG